MPKTCLKNFRDSVHWRHYNSAHYEMSCWCNYTIFKFRKKTYICHYWLNNPLCQEKTKIQNLLGIKVPCVTNSGHLILLDECRMNTMFWEGSFVRQLTFFSGWCWSLLWPLLPMAGLWWKHSSRWWCAEIISCWLGAANGKQTEMALKRSCLIYYHNIWVMKLF